MADQSSPKPTSVTKSPAIVEPSDEQIAAFLAKQAPAPTDDQIAAYLAKQSAADTSDKNADLQEYVVTAAAITLRTGAGKKAVRRFMRGQRLRLHSSEDRVKLMVASKSIAVRGEKLVRSTPAIVFKAMGAQDDPAKPPVQDILPIVPDDQKAVATV